MKNNELLKKLAATLCEIEQFHPLRVAVDGIDASGKTTLTDELAEEIERLGRPVVRSTIDGFHNPAVVRYRRGSFSSEGYYHDSFNFRSIVDCLLLPFGPGGNRCYRTAVFDYRSDQVVDSPVLKADEDAILLFDGIFVQRPELAGFWDATIFLRVPFATALRNAERRFLAANGQGSLSAGIDELQRRYRIRYFPAQQEYMDSVHPGDKADILIDNSDFDNPSLIWNRL